MYARRSKIDPLWNSLVLGGVDPKTGESFLGYVDLLGTTYQSSTIATGFGLHLAQPLLRKAVEGRENDIEEEEAKKILQECMKVLCTCPTCLQMSFICLSDGRSPLFLFSSMQSTATHAA